MRVRPLTTEALRFVLANMRAADRGEIGMLRHASGAEALQAELEVVLQPPLGAGWSFHLDDGTPVAIGGGYEKHPGVAFIFLVATDDLPKLRVPIAKWARRVIPFAFKKMPIHRFETTSFAGRRDAHRWLRFLGAEREAVLSRYGRNGEDFYVYRWLRELQN